MDPVASRILEQAQTDDQYHEALLAGQYGEPTLPLQTTMAGLSGGGLGNSLRSLAEKVAMSCPAGEEVKVAGARYRVATRRGRGPDSLLIGAHVVHRVLLYNDFWVVGLRGANIEYSRALHHFGEHADGVIAAFTERAVGSAAPELRRPAIELAQMLGLDRPPEHPESDDPAWAPSTTTALLSRFEQVRRGTEKWLPAWNRGIELGRLPWHCYQMQAIEELGLWWCGDGFKLPPVNGRTPAGVMKLVNVVEDAVQHYSLVPVGNVAIDALALDGPAGPDVQVAALEQVEHVGWQNRTLAAAVKTKLVDTCDTMGLLPFRLHTDLGELVIEPGQGSGERKLRLGRAVVQGKVGMLEHRASTIEYARCLKAATAAVLRISETAASGKLGHNAALLDPSVRRLIGESIDRTL